MYLIAHPTTFTMKGFLACPTGLSSSACISTELRITHKKTGERKDGKGEEGEMRNKAGLTVNHIGHDMVTRQVSCLDSAI